MLTPRIQVFCVCALAMAVFGLVLALPGAAFGVESVRLHLGLGVDGQARLLATLFAGFLAGTLVSGPLADHAGLRPVLAGAALTVAAGLAAFALASGGVQASAAALLLGIGGASINTSANTLISSLYPERRSAMLTWLAVACAAGGMALPLTVLVDANGWRATLTVAAIVAAGTGLVMARMRAPHVSQAFSWRGLMGVVGAPGFAWYLAALVCQGGNEAALAGWITPHLTARGLAGATALGALTLHWSGIIAGRLCMALIVERIGTRATVTMAAIIASLGTMLLIGARVPGLLLMAAAISGLGISGVFSVVMADAGARYRGRAGTMFAALLASGQAGGMLIPWLVGQTAERAGLGAGLGIVAGTTLAVAVFVLMLSSVSATVPSGRAAPR